MKKNISTQILKCLVVVFALYIVFDYFNTASFLGFHVKNINISLFSAIFNAFVVIALYIVTFIVVDKRQIKKDQNAELTAKILMQSSYKKCIDLLKIVSDQEILEKNIVPKIDFNQIGLNEVEERIQNNPFTEYSFIVEFSISGNVEHEDLNTYVKIMEVYKSYITMRITFFDIWESSEAKHIQLQQKMRSDKRNLDRLLEEEIDKIQKSLKEDGLNNRL